MKKIPELYKYVVKYYNSDSGILLENLKNKEYILLSEFQNKVNYKNNSIYPLIVKNLIDGLNLLHKYGIYHLDIKGNNIFINKDTGEIKYIDFGSSIINENLQQIKSNNKEQTFSSNLKKNFNSNNKEQIFNNKKLSYNSNKYKKPINKLSVIIPNTPKNNKYIPSFTIYYILKEHIKNLTKENLKLLDKVALGLVLFNIFPDNMKSVIPNEFEIDYNSYVDFINTKLDEVDDIIYPLNNSLKQYLKTNLIFLTLNIIQEKNKEIINY